MLAGCAATPAADDAGAHDAHDGTAVANVINAPQWEIGDWWTWSSMEGTMRTHAVSGESAGDWVVDTDDADFAFFNARSDISMMGKIRKSDLAGSQGADRVEFFRFPMQAHMNWTTTWDGAMTHIHVAEVADGVASIEAARHDGTNYADYTYDSKTENFGAVAFYNADGTEIAYESRVTASGSKFTGALVRWDLDVVVDLHGAIPTNQALQYTVPATVTDVYIAGSVDCVNGAIFVATGPPQGPAQERGYSVVGNCPLQDQDEYVASVAPAQDETWGLIATSAPTTAGTLDLTVWLRTRLEFEAGNAPPL